MNQSPDPLLHALYFQALPYRVLAVRLVEDARSCRLWDGTLIPLKYSENTKIFLSSIEDGPAGYYLRAAVRFIQDGEDRNTNLALSQAFLSNPSVPLQILVYGLHPEWFDLGNPADPHDAGDYINIEPQIVSLLAHEDYRSGPDWAAVFGYAVGSYWRQIPGLSQWLHRRAWRSGLLRAIGPACLAFAIPDPKDEQDATCTFNDRRRWIDEGRIGGWEREQWERIIDLVRQYRDKQITISELSWMIIEKD